MKYLKAISFIAGISLLGLVSCSANEQANVSTTSTASPDANVTSAPTTSTKGNSALLGVVAKTKTAVKSGNFVQAKKEFDKFEDGWKEVEDGIKAKSRAKYDTIEKNLDEVKGELKASKPQKEKLLKKLQSLEKAITAVGKS